VSLCIGSQDQIEDAITHPSLVTQLYAYNLHSLRHEVFTIYSLYLCCDKSNDGACHILISLLIYAKQCRIIFVWNCSLKVKVKVKVKLSLCFS
jgi:hypothetical protein